MPGSELGKIENCVITSDILSDHSVVELTLVLHEALKGRGYWKLNNKLLEEKQYVNQINEIIDYGHYRYEEVDPGLRWELIKKDISEFSIYYSRSRAANSKKEKEIYLDKLNKLQKKLACINLKSWRSIKIIEKTNEK